MVDLEKILEKVCSVYDDENQNKMPDGSIIFDRPSFGVADAGDSLFEEFKKPEIIGSIYKPPQYWLPGAASVIAYFLPFTDQVRKSNYGGTPPSLEWLHARFLGESFNEKLRANLVAQLEAMGGSAVAPLLMDDYHADYEIFASSWSERHAAFAAGLGSFGLHRGLITEKGVAGRIGSVITNLHFNKTSRPEGFYYQNCPYLVDQSCGLCIDRCPAGAITEQGKDKAKCYQYMFVDDHMRQQRESFGYKHSICGKCQVDVPCEDSIPDR